MRISPYVVFLTGDFYSKRTWKECFFIGKTKESQKFQYQQSYMSYKSYTELQKLYWATKLTIYNILQLFYAMH